MSAAAERFNPYPGLRPFEMCESHLFFGRDGQSDALIEKLENHRFVAVVGTSGSGKSSLVRAGLLTALHSGFMASAGSSWKVAICRPGADPILNLAVGLAEAAGNSDEDSGRSGDAAIRGGIIAAGLRRTSEGIVSEAAKFLPADGRLFVLVDQFEELFRFRESSGNVDARDESAAFVKLLLRAAGQRTQSIYVLITMRSDFLGDCAQFRDLPEAINRSQYLVPRMTYHQRRDAISGPAKVGGAEIAPGLLQRLLNDVGDNPDQLPILQHALMRTWDYWERNHVEGEAIDLKHYQAAGEMASALSDHADEAYEDLAKGVPGETGARRKALAEKLFRCITERGPDNREIRRPCRLVDICKIVDAREEELIPVIDTFRREGRSFLMPPPNAEKPLDAASLLDISHESLIRQWNRLREWVDQEHRDQREYRRLVDTARRHMEERGGWMRDPDLQFALNWREQALPAEAWAQRVEPSFQFSEAMGFLETSRRNRDDEEAERRRKARRAEAASRRSARRRRLAFAALGLLTLGAAVSALLAWKNVQLAELREAETQRERTRSAALHLLHRAANLSANGRLPEALGLLCDAYSLSPDFSTRSALLDGLVHAPAELESTFHGFGQGIERLSFGNDGKLFAASPLGDWWILDTGNSPGLISSSSQQTQTARFLALEPTQDGWSGWLEDGRNAQLSAEGCTFGPGASQWLMAASSGEFTAHVPAGSPRRVLVQSASVPVTTEMENRVACLAMSVGGLLAVGLEDGSVLLLENGRPTGQLREGSGAAVASMSWSATEVALLLVGDEHGTLAILSREASATRPDPPSLPCRPVSSVWSPADRRIAVAGGDGRVRILVPDGDGYQVESLDYHRGPVLCVDWSADGKRLASGGQDGAVALWYPGKQHEPFVRRNLFEAVVSLDASTDGKRIAAGTAAGRVYAWEQGDDPQLTRTEIAGGGVHSLAWDPEASRLAAGTGDDKVLVLRPGQGNPLAVFEGTPGAHPDEVPVPRVRWSPSGTFIAAASYARTVRVLDTASGTSRTLGALPDLALGLAWTKNGDKLAAGSTRGEIFLLDPRAESAADLPSRLDGSHGHEQSVGGLAWSPTGFELASCSNDGTVRLWNPAVGSAPRAVSTPVDSHLEEVVYSADGKLLATAGSDGFLRLWSADNLDPVAAFRAHDGHAGAVVWRANRLISASEDGSVLSVSLDEEQWRNRARTLSGVSILHSQPPSQ
ncbi:MAG TPA: hypothetical protein VMN36_08325 [Verrucomicrobiales bacterium]|nr:hypothetical protein [Verrucomicrobiales bacterium]